MNVRSDMVQCYVVRVDASREAEFLQLRRAAEDYMGGTWQTVSGRIEAGETAWQAALRELREEAGLTPVELYRLDGINSFYVDGSDTLWHCPLFCAIVAGGAVVRMDHEHEDHRWVPRRLAEGYFMWPGDRRAVRQVCEEILDNGPAKPYLRIDLRQQGEICRFDSP